MFSLQFQSLCIKRAPSLRDKFVKSFFDLPNQPSFVLENQVVFFECGRYYACREGGINFRRRKEFFIATTTGKKCALRDFVSCFTEGVIYMLQCPCGYQNVGRTSRQLSTCMRKHVYNIRKRFLKYSVSKHFKIHHDREPKGLQFWGIEKVKKHWRGGNFITQLSRNESWWIYNTKVLTLV